MWGAAAQGAPPKRDKESEPMTPDPYVPYLLQADELFARGEVVKAGQIWQAILKQQPSHVEARQKLLSVKERLQAIQETEATAPPLLREPRPSRALEGEDPAPPPRMVLGGERDAARLLAEGCTLYDMGQLEDALHKWELLLAQDPSHALARSYASGARRELGLAPLQTPAAPAAGQPEGSPASIDIDKLLREAVQLYDMGLTEDAADKWEQVLLLEPHRQEVEVYLRRVRVELAESAAASAQRAPAVPTAPAPSPAAAAVPEADSDTEALDLKLRQAEHLLTLQRQEEAAFTFQQALHLDPGNARALEGLMRCRKPGGRVPASSPRSILLAQQEDTSPRIAMAEEAPAAVEPPAALLRTLPVPRGGLAVPNQLRDVAERLPWIKDRRTLAGGGGGLLVLVLGTFLFQNHRKDQALKEEVRTARAAAIAPVSQQAQVPTLVEATEAIRQEAETTLVTDPLRAYLRAETLINRNPADAAAAQLLEKARTGLPGGVTGATLSEYQKHLQNGDLEAAAKVMDALLRDQPSAEDLRARAAHLYLALCSAHAAQARWEAAREDLLRGRALRPADKTWQARLHLLEQVQTMPKAQQAAWISLLG